MRKTASFLVKISGWGICALLFPFAASLFIFSVIHVAAAIAFFLFLLLVFPRLVKRKIPLLSAVLLTEILMIALLVYVYTSDRRPRECGFPLDRRVVPILTWSGCIRMAPGSVERNECLQVVENPYDLALYGGKLYVVSGRDDSTLGELDPVSPGGFQAYGLGFGNIQQIVPDPGTGMAVLPMWKDRKIVLLDLKNKKPVKIFRTDVGKLIGARRSGDRVFVISELAKMFVVDLETLSMKRRDLGYRFHTLYDIEVDETRNAIFLSDWVWGRVYRLDAGTLETVAQRPVGIVATGLALDEKTCELFTSRPLASEIVVLDCETLERKRSIPAGFGVHEIALSGDGKKIHAVRYTPGTFRTMDREKGTVIREVRIGGQARALLVDWENNRVFAATKCGIYRVSP